MLCTYQWYAPPCIPGADVRDWKEILPLEGLVLSQGWSNPLIHSLLLCQMSWKNNFDNTYISQFHTVLDKET